MRLRLLYCWWMTNLSWISFFTSRFLKKLWALINFWTSLINLLMQWVLLFFVLLIAKYSIVSFLIKINCFLIIWHLYNLWFLFIILLILIFQTQRSFIFIFNTVIECFIHLRKLLTFNTVLIWYFFFLFFLPRSLKFWLNFIFLHILWRFFKIYWNSFDCLPDQISQIYIPNTFLFNQHFFFEKRTIRRLIAWLIVHWAFLIFLHKNLLSLRWNILNLSLISKLNSWLNIFFWFSLFC